MVTTIPGPCAAIAALTLAGLPTDRFAFFGFLPAKPGQRAAAIAETASFPGSLIFYESGPRLGTTLAALAEGLGNRDAAVAREISKAFEETVSGTLAVLAERYRDTAPKGEIVIVVGPPLAAEPAGEAEIDALLAELLADHTPSRAAAEAARILNVPKRLAYDRAQKLK
jgi:16S rRNA (cytidine1402-2'-O)-methyltransferase